VKIALINEYFPPFAPGGAEWSSFYLGQALVKRGHQVTVITPNYGTVSAENMDGLQVVRFAYPARLKGKRNLNLRWLASPLFYLWSAFHIWRIGRRYQFDVLHAENKYMIPGVWLAGKALHRPVVATIRDTLTVCPFGRCLMVYDEVPANCGCNEMWQLCRDEHIAVYIRPRNRLLFLKARLTTSYLRWDTYLRRWFLSRLDGVIAVSQGILEVYRQAKVTLGRKATVVYNIPPEPTVVTAKPKTFFGLPPGPLVLYVGKFSPGKGTADLVAAAKQVVQTMPNAQFAFAGGSELDGTEGIGNIHILGRLPHEEIESLYQIADVVVSPSVWPEPLTRVLLEAMAFGRAVIGTKVGGTPELIEHSKNGLLTPRRSPQALAEAIIYLLQDSQARQMMGENGRQRLQEKFNPDRSIEQLLSFYRSTRNTP
jgi:glycosyltransferase involved in cell wall biosynthesis